MKMKTPITAIAIASLLSACSITAGERAALSEAKIVAGVCDVLSPITYDGKLDTQPTKDQIKRYNAARGAFCKIPSKETR